MHLTFITATLTWEGSLPQLIPQIQTYLHPYGIPLRWAITAVTGQELTLEAVVIQGEFTPTPTP
ncbi:MAG: hypothetical protein Q6J44_08780 [Gloeomargarita sp. DG02_4_bins_56]